MTDVEYIPVTMVREDLEGLPEHPLPAGFHWRLYQPGDEAVWAEIEASVNEFPTRREALSHFQAEFGPYPEEMQQRCIFLCRGTSGQEIGTATAWYGELKGQRRGRLHWVAIRPEFQGQGLGKPLVSAALQRMAALHSRAYLTTQTTSYVAVKIYLDFGFVPFLSTERCKRAWRLLAEILNHPRLEKYRGCSGWSGPTGLEV